MNILITGAKGFIGRNLIEGLQNYNPAIKILEYDIDSTEEELNTFCLQADFVYDLVGVMRPQNTNEFMAGNFNFTKKLVNKLVFFQNFCPIVYSSSIQAEQDNPYGLSKKAAEDFLKEFAQHHQNKVVIYRFNNVFGKWKRPNYDSVVATFCYNIGRGLPIKINDPNAKVCFIYIEDVVNELIAVLENKEHYMNGFGDVTPKYSVTVGELASLINEINLDIKKHNNVKKDEFYFKMYKTYISYLPDNYKL